MNNEEFLVELESIGACDEAKEWVSDHGGTVKELWKDCERGDWMTWIIVKDQDNFGVTRKQIIPALCDCAELSLHHFENKYPNDNRPRNALKVARLWADGKATDFELSNAAYAAYAAYAATAVVYAAAADAYAAYAATAVAYAATAVAYAAADAAADATTTAAAAADAAADADADADARSKTLQQCADIFRKHFPNLNL
jgi:hypothetical protein